MNPIAFALRRPITVMVLVFAVVLAGLTAIRPKALDETLRGYGIELPLKRMPVDIFPSLNLPVIYVSQPYGGMDPAQMEGLLTNYYEYHFLYISGIHHVESRNIQGSALMKLYFHPGTNMAQAMAETINYVNRARAFMPPGTVSPFVMRFDTGSVPVGYLVLSSGTKTIAEIQDQALFKVRPMFSSLPGVSAPPPFGGSARSIVIRTNPQRLQAYRLSPDDVVTALTQGNTISPSGNLKLGDRYPIVPMNAMVRDIRELGNIPVATTADSTVYIRDLGTIEDATDITTGYALVNGRRAVYILATKRADASTMSVIDEIKNAIPAMQKELPDDIRVSFEFDQSPYVTRAIQSLTTEGLLGAFLTGLMVLIFLRDWRSALVVVLNIPLAILASILGLWLTGQTINLMTLGGLALAVGILVDEATVEIENIHTQFAKTDSIAWAVRLGNAQTAVPRLLAMLCILAVFVPSFFMQGAPREMFAPLSLAVGFAMIASYVLSSTFVPVLSVWLLRHRHAHATGGTALPKSSRRLGRINAAIQSPRESYAWLLKQVVHLRWIVAPVYLVGCGLLIWFVAGRLGTEIFPTFDAGEFRLRLRAPDGTHIDKTEQIALQTLDVVKQEVGEENVALTLGYVGTIPAAFPINSVYQFSRGPEEAILRIALKHGSGVSTESMKEVLRTRLRERFPDVRYSFEPADIVSEVMSFGSPTPIEVAVRGGTIPENRAFLKKVEQSLGTLPALRDVQVVQSLDYPTIDVKIDREKAGMTGTTASQVARSVLAATSSSRFVVPNYWPDPKTGIGYQVQVEIPQPNMNSVNDLATVPVRQAANPVLLRDVAEISNGTMPGEFDRYNMKRELTLTANIAGADLGSVSGDVVRKLNEVQQQDNKEKDALEKEALQKGQPKPGRVTYELRGQIPPLRQMLSGLGVGLLLAILVIFLLLAANFQSLRLALVTVSAVPAVITGVLLALLVTGSTLNIESFIGAIMGIGVAMANAILLVTFAQQEQKTGASSGDAAVKGATARFRPIVMTSAAMLAGMLPIAMAWGEAGQQTAPLGRAVMGALIAATLATLLVVPAFFVIVQRSRATIRFVRSSRSRKPAPQSRPRLARVKECSQMSSPVTCFAFVSCLVLVGCDHRTATESGQAGTATTDLPKVSTGFPVRKAIAQKTEQPGQIEAFAVAPIHAKVSGYVKTVLVDIGDKVQGPKIDSQGKVLEPGRILAVIDSPELIEDVRQKEARVAQAKADSKQAEAAIRVAEAAEQSANALVQEARSAAEKSEADFQRWKSEFARIAELAASKTVTQKLADETRQQLRAAEAAKSATAASIQSAMSKAVEAKVSVEKSKADADSVKARLAVSEADLRSAQVMVDYLTLRAPFTGVISERNVDPGRLVQSAKGASDPSLFTVIQADTVRLFIEVPEAEAVLVGPGRKATIRVSASSGKSLAGTVTRTSWSLASSNRTLRTEIDIPNSKGLLRPGMFAQVELTVAERESAIVVPRSAVITLDGQTCCLAVGPGGELQKRPVVTGLKTATEVEIVSGLTEKDEVLVANVAAFKPGQKVAKSAAK